MPDYDDADPSSWPEEEPPENPFEEPPPPLQEGAIAKQDDEQAVDRQTALIKFLRSHLLTSEQLDSVPAPVPLVGDEHLFVNTLNWLVGKPGHGKSFVALDLAGCVGTGTPWHRYPVVQHRVLYIAAEGVSGVRQRVRAWEHKHGRRMTGVEFLPFPVQSTNGAHWGALVGVAAESGYGLIIIDTQARVTVGVEENSNKEMGTFVHQAERLRLASGACTLLVHHVGSGGERGRGATTLDGALTTIMRCEKGEGGLVTLSCQKNKDAPEWPEIEFQMVPSLSSAVLVATSNLGASLIRTIQDDVMWTAKRWWEHYRDEWQTAKSLEEVTTRTKSTFARHRQDLTKHGYVESTGGKLPRYRLTGDPSVPPGDRREVSESEPVRPVPAPPNETLF